MEYTLKQLKEALDVYTVTLDMIYKWDKERTNMESISKWSCRSCGIVIPYNPDYDMSNVNCATCQCYVNSDKLLKGYRMPTKR